MTKSAIGIDIGTTYSRVAVMRANHVEIIPNEQGDHLTPSCVAFTGNARLVGEAANNQAIMNPRNTIVNAKRMLGRGNEHKSVNFWPLAILCTNNDTVIEVEHLGEVDSFTIVEIISMLLQKMRSIAQSFLGESITNVVLTVPASFSHLQCQLMRDAGTIIGLNVIRIINDSTAAAFLYTFQEQLKHIPKDRNILVFDLGGGHCNASLVSIHQGALEVKATAGDSCLGGQDFDNRLLKHFVDEFQMNHELDLTIDVRALCRLRIACERAKHNLSISNHTTIDIESLFQGIDFHSSITRVEFENLCHDQFLRCLVPIESVFSEQQSSKMCRSIHKNAIDEVILIGGSSRIPKIQQLISQFFDGKKLCKSLNANEATACGAAVQSAILTGLRFNVSKEILLTDVVSAPFGIETKDGVRTEFIERNSTIPCSQSHTFFTDVDNQSSFSFDIYEGDMNDRHLGKFDLLDISPDLRGAQQIEVTFDMDANGCFRVSAMSSAVERKKGKKGSNNQKSITNKKTINVTTQFCQLSTNQIKLMSATATSLLKQDQQHMDYLASKHQLEQCVYCIGSDDVQEYVDWIENNINASTLEFEIKHKQLHERFPTQTCSYDKIQKNSGTKRKHSAIFDNNV